MNSINKKVTAINSITIPVSSNYKILSATSTALSRLIEKNASNYISSVSKNVTTNKT